MKEIKNENSQDLDIKIAAAMEKIVHDTVIPISYKNIDQSVQIKSEQTLKASQIKSGDQIKKLDQVKKSIKKPTRIKKSVSVKKPDQINKPAQVKQADQDKKTAQVKHSDQVKKTAQVEQADQMQVPIQKKKAEKKKNADPNRHTIKRASKLKSGSGKGITYKVIRILLSLVGLALLCVYGGFAYYYHDKFMPGTRINGILCKEMSAEETEALIEKRVEDYAINITFREQKGQSISGADISYNYVSDGSVKKILDNQKSLLWFLGYFKEFKYEITEGISYDEAKLTEQYNQLICLQPDAQVAPKNAFVNFQNGQFEIVPEVEGTTIDSNVLLPALKEAISKSKRELSAETAGAYVQPEIRSDKESLTVERDELNALGTPSILYKLPQGDEVLDGNTTRTWLVVDEQGHYSKDEAVFEERLIEYVATLAEKTDTVGTERPFLMTGGREIMVGGGSYGWKINQNEEIALLKQNIANNEQIEREPIYSTREVTTENNGFGNTYIEINLGDQHLYYYENGEIVVESPFVSGRMTKSRYTPPGIFNMYYKQKDRVLRGEKRPDGTYEYESPVNFWMPFNRGIGLHDASWRGSFGGSIYRYSGSHGCINMPYKKAKAIYERITKEVPIICYYPDGYSLH